MATSYSLDVLEAAIKLEILILQRRGGITDWHIAEAQRRLQSIRQDNIGESILYLTEHTRHSFTIYVECIAVLAFLPGGVTVAGRSFQVPEQFWYTGEQKEEGAEHEQSSQ